LVHTRTFRLVASKYPLSTLSYDNLSTYLSRRLKQNASLHKATLGAERSNIEKHKSWLQSNLKSTFGDVLQNGSETPAFYSIQRKRHLVFGFMLPTEKAKKVNTALPDLNLLVKNTKEFQKYIIKVEQQSLVFETHRISTSFSNHEVLTDMQIEQKKTLMSHTDASRNWFALKGNRFSVGFRPIKVKEVV